MKTKLMLIVVGASLYAAVTLAQSYSIDLHTIAGGGGTSTGGGYSLSGTIGQPDAGLAMTGGNFSLTGGFWSLFAVQTPGAPLLTITLTSTNTALLSWPVSALNFQLHENTNLALPNGWSPVAQPTLTNGAQISLTIPASAERKFFRLKSH